MKILCVMIPPGKENSDYGQYVKSVYAPAMQKNIDLLMQEGTRVVYRTCQWGVPVFEAPLYRHVAVLASRIAFYAAVKAEKEGFDGVLIDCFGDPMLHELRQELDIPVVSLAESSLLLSTVMGKKFGIVAVGENDRLGIDEDVKRYGLKHSYAGCEALPPESAEGLGPALIDANVLLDSFKISARKLIDHGAEIVIPGCSLMSLAARLAPGMEAEYPNGLTEVDGLAVADLIGDAMTLLNTLICLKRAGSTWISRKERYKMPTPREKEILKTVTEDKTLKFWNFIPEK